MRRSISILMMILVAGAAGAADTDQKEHQLAVRHYAGVIELRSGAGSVIDARGVPASREVLEHGGSLDEAESVARRALPL